jgi:predicted nucleic acid-binding protein
VGFLLRMKNGMTANRYTFDTNIYFYSLEESAGLKHSRARDLIRNAGAGRSVVLLQVLGELSNAISKRKPHLLSAAEMLVETVAEFALPAHPDDLRAALAIHRTHGLQVWDALIWATAQRAGCTILFTEDLQHTRTLGSVTFVNPFLLSTEDLAGLLA